MRRCVCLRVFTFSMVLKSSEKYAALSLSLLCCPDRLISDQNWNSSRGVVIPAHTHNTRRSVLFKYICVTLNLIQTHAEGSRPNQIKFSVNCENSPKTSDSERLRFPESSACECLSTEPRPTSRSVSKDWSFESNDLLHFSSWTHTQRQKFEKNFRCYFLIIILDSGCVGAQVWPEGEPGRRPVSELGTECWWVTPALRRPGRICSDSPLISHTDEV